MKRLVLILISFFFILSTHSLIHAAEPGINIGTKYEDLDRALSVVQPGGWIVVIAGGTGNCVKLDSVLAKAASAGVNVIIRGHLNNNLTPNDAKAWVATLGKLSTPNKVYFMPWNEPNQEGSGDYAPASVVRAYTDALLTESEAAGIRGKIAIMSPALNITHPNRESYIDALGGGNYFSRFDIIALNTYDNSEEVCGTPLCNSDIYNNPGRTRDVLNRMGVGNKNAVIIESGTSGNNFYFKQSPSSNSPLYRFVRDYGTSGQYPFAIPSYDLGGEVGHTWSLFSPPDTANKLSSLPKGSTTPASIDQGKFDGWLNNLINSGELILCTNCGYAHNSNWGLCNGTSGPSFTELPSTCDLNNPGDQTSRPVPCQACNQTNNMVSSCAETFTVSGEVGFKKKDGDQCSDDNGITYWVDNEWGGLVTVDPYNTIIPFVGKRGEEDEGMYLADYYEGTNIYYDAVCDPADQECLKKAITEGGVWRKLASPELQDLFKRKMIKRVNDSKYGSLKEGAVRDYLVIYQKPGQTAHSARVSEIGNHQPPFPNEEDYSNKLQTWKDTDGGKWFYLWAAMPMFSREDTVGRVIPYLGRNRLDQFTIQNMEKSTIEQVPHLARLYETTSAINQLILPKLLQANNVVDSNSNPPQIANQNLATPKLLASNEKLLAEAPCRNCPVPNIIDPRVENGALRYSLQICPSCTGYGTIGDVLMGSCGNPSQVHSVVPECFNSDDASIAPPVPISCPGTATICSSVRADRDVDDSCRGQFISTVCTVTVDAGCKVVQSDCGVGGPPAPKCGPLPVKSVPECKKDAETGTGDPICCGPIQIDLKAVDRIQNTEHTNCNPLAYPFGGDPCEDGLGPFPVSRKIGIALSHPYLEQIWKNTTDISTGFLNIFRLTGYQPFEDKEAKGTIIYSGVNATPSSGDFYYPHLGGIQKAKEFVVNELSNTP